MRCTGLKTDISAIRKSPRNYRDPPLCNFAGAEIMDRFRCPMSIAQSFDAPPGYIGRGSFSSSGGTSRGLLLGGDVLDFGRAGMFGAGFGFA